MNEFKFDCSVCGQHILAAHEWIGRQIECPSCNTKLTIPAPKQPKEEEPVKLPAPKPEPKTSDTLTPAGSGTKTSEKQPVQPPAAPPSLKVQRPEKPKAAAAPSNAKAPPAPGQAPGRLRVAVLTPAIKLEIVHSVRGRIANESTWLPGKIEGESVYAAKVVDGQTVPVEATNPEATRFSLIGAFLLEFQLRQVIRTATGRTRLLNEEIPEAIRKVLAAEMNEEARKKGEDPLAQQGRKALSHAQCLAVLEALENRYAQRTEQARVEKAQRALGSTRLADLVKRLEDKAPVAPEDVATALYHELMDVRRRLEKLESRNKQTK